MSAQPITQIIDAALSGHVVVNIGQVDPPTARALNRLVAAGTLARWRGKWHPVPGARHGIGPDKTCWGLASQFWSDR